MVINYRVMSCARSPRVYYVVTGEGDKEVIVTKFTRDWALADRWCCRLRRAAQIEADRKHGK